MKKLIIPMMNLTFLFSLVNLNAQNNSLRIYTGYAIGKADQRIDFLKKQYPILIYQTAENLLQKNTPDDEYFIGIGYSKLLKNRLSLGINLGYARLVQDLRLPVNSQSYFGDVREIFLWRDKSYYHLIQAVPEIKFIVIDKKVKLGLSFSGIGNVSFLKHSEIYSLKASRIEYFSTELYPGVFLSYNGLTANLGIRTIHWKNRDDAIANNGLKLDTYNPFKMRFALSYDIYKW
ncbi:MAG: hypothetical protein J5I59_10940 [Saprospiraceae bacterium]|nr:hypothetical protein [Saprospiraceae bacterium]